MKINGLKIKSTCSCSAVAQHTSSKAQESNWELYKADQPGDTWELFQNLVNSLEEWFHESWKDPRQQVYQCVP